MSRNGPGILAPAALTAVALLASSSLGCGLVSVDRSTVGSAPARAGERGFGLGVTQRDFVSLSASSHQVDVRVEHAASVEPRKQRDEVWRVRGADVPTTIGVVPVPKTETLVFCTGEKSTAGEQCVFAIERDENGKELGPVRGFPTLLEPENLGLESRTIHIATDRYSAHAVWGVVTDPAPPEDPGQRSRARRATPNFGVWVLQNPVGWSAKGPATLPQLSGGPLFFCSRTTVGPRCQLAQTSQNFGHVLSVNTLRRGDRYEHVVWYRQLNVPKIVRCRADDQDATPTCQTIEVL